VSVLNIILTVKIGRKTDRSGVFSFQNYKIMMAERTCMSKKIDVVMSEKLGMKAMVPGNGKTYEIKWYDCNEQVKMHMPTVAKMFIDKYLRISVKDTTQVKRGMFSSNAWQ
jgi:hypothetical protein